MGNSRGGGGGVGEGGIVVGARLCFETQNLCSQRLLKLSQ